MNFTDQPSVARPSLVLGAILFAVAAVVSFGLIAGQAQSSTGGVGSTSLADAQPKKTKASRQAAKGKKVANRYARLWSNVSRKNKRWASRTAECESGGNPKAIGGGGIYRGAFQFMRATWRTSPKSPGGDPIRYTYKTQAFVAVKLKMRDGAGHWPVCG